MKVLVIYKALLGTKRLKKSVLDHLKMFEFDKKGCDVVYWNIADGAPTWLSKVHWNTVVLHTTFLSIRYGEQSLYYYWRRRFKWLETDPSIKVAFPQDERYFNLEIQDWLNSMSSRVLLFSVFGDHQSKLNKLYPSLDPNIETYPCLTGYINQSDLLEPPLTWKHRTVDILYRAKKLPPWVGRYGQLKFQIGEKLKLIAQSSNLIIDTSTNKNDVLLGGAWLKALSNSKYIVGCEAGGSGVDERGAITSAIHKYRKANNGVDPNFQEIDSMFQYKWDGFNFRTLGPRNLEAVMTKTCQILVEGEYSNILQQGKHYIAVKKDLSNLDDIINNLSDEIGIQIAEQAYSDITSKPELTYEGFAESVFTKLDSHIEQPHTPNYINTLLFWLTKVINIVCNTMPVLLQWPNLIKLWFISMLARRTH